MLKFVSARERIRIESFHRRQFMLLWRGVIFRGSAIFALPPLFIWNTTRCICLFFAWGFFIIIFTARVLPVLPVLVGRRLVELWLRISFSLCLCFCLSNRFSNSLNKGLVVPGLYSAPTLAAFVKQLTVANWEFIIFRRKLFLWPWWVWIASTCARPLSTPITSLSFFFAPLTAFIVLWFTSLAVLRGINLKFDDFDLFRSVSAWAFKHLSSIFQLI